MSSKSVLKTALALAAACTLWSGSANAADFTINLFGDPAFGSNSSQVFNNTLFEQYVLSLSGLEGQNSITVDTGDTITANVTLASVFTLPASVSFTSFALLPSGDNFPLGDTGATGYIEFFLAGNSVFSTTGSATSSSQIPMAVFVTPPDNIAYNFDSFTAVFTIDAVGGPATLDQAVMTYNLASPAAVPEPATWAMMIIGFGGVGALMRRRRQDGGGLAAFA
jgi:hypothetical protein